VFFNGSLQCFDDGKKVEGLLSELGYETVFLAEGKLFDVGSILFFK
jgi:hypothetical protein